MRRDKIEAVIPLKWRGGKTRLHPFLSREEREELIIHMLRDVLFTLSRTGVKRATIVCTTDERGVMESYLGDIKIEKDFIFDKRGLNEAINEIISNNKSSLLILMSDLPLIRTQDIEEIISYDEDVVIAPGRKGGTNIIFLKEGVRIEASYYGLSFLNHVFLLRDRKMRFAVYDSFFTSTDIDEVDDLIEVLVHNTGETSRYLTRIGVAISITDGRVQLRRC